MPALLREMAIGRNTELWNPIGDLPCRCSARSNAAFGHFAVPHLTIGLILCQIVVYAAAQAELLKAGQGGLQQRTVLDRIALVPEKVLEGQVWRLVTFVCEPPVTNVVFAFFFWYMFYLMGEALELSWGTFRYNVYLLIGYLATAAVSFLTPEVPASIGFLEGSVFLAFAALFPDFEISLFFLLPVKIKWLALLAWIGYFSRWPSGPGRHACWCWRRFAISCCSSTRTSFTACNEAGGAWHCRPAASASSRNRTSTAAQSAALPIAVIPRRVSAIAASARAITATAWNTCTTTSTSKRERSHEIRQQTGPNRQGQAAATISNSRNSLPRNANVRLQRDDAVFSVEGRGEVVEEPFVAENDRLLGIAWEVSEVQTASPTNDNFVLRAFK